MLQSYLSSLILKYAKLYIQNIEADLQLGLWGACFQSSVSFISYVVNCGTSTCNSNNIYASLSFHLRR